jgi:hypothetical protein
MEEAADCIFVDVGGDAAARCTDQLDSPRPDAGLGGQYRRQTARQARPLREAARQSSGPHVLDKNTRTVSQAGVSNQPEHWQASGEVLQTAGGAGGTRTHDRQIMRSTLVRNRRLTSNDAHVTYPERTHDPGTSKGAGPRPGPRRETYSGLSPSPCVTPSQSDRESPSRTPSSGTQPARP